MYYKKQLEKAKKYDIDIISLDVANEVDCSFNIELTDDEFELICGFVEECYLKSEYSNIWSLTKALYDLITDEENKLSIEDLINKTSRYDLIEKASWYD